MNETKTGISRVERLPTEQWLDAALKDLERVFIMRIEEGNATLLADMEFGEYGQVKLQQMDFETDTTLPVYDSAVECRGYYAGGIYIEDMNPLLSQYYALLRFLQLREIKQYVMCANVPLKDVAKHLSGIVCIVVEA